MTARSSSRSGVMGLVAAGLVAAPVIVGAVYAAAGALGLTGLDAHGFSTTHVSRVLWDPTVWRGVVWTLLTASAATLLAAIAAIAIALGVRGDRIGSLLAATPLPIPHVAAATLGVLVLGQSGLLARLAYPLGWVHTPADMPALILDPLGIGFVLTLAWKETPFLAVVAMSILATRGAPLEELARTLGASRIETLARVTVPLLWRGLAPAAVAAFIFVAGSFEGAYLLAPSRPLALPLLTFERYAALDSSDRADAYVLALVGLALGAVAVIALEWLRARWSDA